MPRYIVAFYEIDRAYGGAEEGGWYFNTGAFKRIFKVEKTEEAARRAARRANRILDTIQKKIDVGSVLYNGGRYQAEVHEDFAPKFYPEVRPYYE